MNRWNKEFLGILTIGAGRRFAIAGLLVVALWILFFWATASTGGS